MVPLTQNWVYTAYLIVFEMSINWTAEQYLKKKV